MRETWTFHGAGKLVFGPNAVRQLGDVAAWLGVRRVLVVTDLMLQKAGVVKHTVYDGIAFCLFVLLGQSPDAR